jgi:hypothetical protein
LGWTEVFAKVLYSQLDHEMQISAASLTVFSSRTLTAVSLVRRCRFYLLAYLVSYQQIFNFQIVYWISISFTSGMVMQMPSWSE